MLLLFYKFLSVFKLFINRIINVNVFVTKLIIAITVIVYIAVVNIITYVISDTVAVKYLCYSLKSY